MLSRTIHSHRIFSSLTANPSSFFRLSASSLSSDAFGKSDNGSSNTTSSSSSPSSTNNHSDVESRQFSLYERSAAAVPKHFSQRKNDDKDDHKSIMETSTSAVDKDVR